MDDLMFGEFLPDFPDFKNPGCTIADNVIPRPGGYAPQFGLTAQSQTVTGAIRGALLGFSGTTAAIIGGTSSHLFKNLGGTVTSAAVASTVGSSECWDFCRFNEYAIATSIANSPYHLPNMDFDTAWVHLPGSPPNARYCERVGDFVMLGDIADFPNRIQWSHFNSPGGSWTPARLTQAGYADLPHVLGSVQRIVGGRYPLVFQERGVSQIEYIGPPGVFRAVQIEQGRGCIAPFSVVSVGFVTYYLAQDGFWVTDGNSFQPIGGQKVNAWFRENAAPASISSVHGTLDFENECVVWAFKSGTVFDRLIRYSWTEDRWSTATVEVDRLVEAVLGGYTLEQLAVLYPTLESVPASLDDPRWRGRNRVLSAYVDGDTTTDLNTFTGPWQAVPGRRVATKRAKVLGEGAVWEVAAITTDNSGNEEQRPFTAPMAGGWAPMRADGMTIRVKARTEAEALWRRAQGVQVDFRPSGAR
jgi:hypothetical protein